MMSLGGRVWRWQKKDKDSGKTTEIPGGMEGGGSWRDVNYGGFCPEDNGKPLLSKPCLEKVKRHSRRQVRRVF